MTILKYPVASAFRRKKIQSVRFVNQRSNMRVLLFCFAALTAVATGRAQTPAAAQVAAAPAQTGQTVCGQPVPTPKGLPPVGGGPVVYQVVPCFEKQGGFPVVEANTYLYYI